MAKNKRNRQLADGAQDTGTDATDSVDGEVSDETVTMGNLTFDAPAPADPVAAPAVETLDLHDAARRWVPGYKEHWWPGIKRHGEALGFPGSGTAEACKAVLRHWGAKIS